MFYLNFSKTYNHGQLVLVDCIRERHIIEVSNFHLIIQPYLTKEPMLLDKDCKCRTSNTHSEVFSDYNFIYFVVEKFLDLKVYLNGVSYLLLQGIEGDMNDGCILSHYVEL